MSPHFVINFGDHYFVPVFQTFFLLFLLLEFSVSSFFDYVLNEVMLT